MSFLGFKGTSDLNNEGVLRADLNVPDGIVAFDRSARISIGSPSTGIAKVGAAAAATIRRRDVVFMLNECECGGAALFGSVVVCLVVWKRMRIF